MNVKGIFWIAYAVLMIVGWVLQIVGRNLHDYESSVVFQKTSIVLFAIALVISIANLMVSCGAMVP